MNFDWSLLMKTHVNMGLVLIIILFALVLIVWAYQRDETNRVELKDLFCTNDEMDSKKFFTLGAWIVSTWGFIYLIVDERFSEWYFAGYMAAWVGNSLVDKYLTNRKAETKEQ